MNSEIKLKLYQLVILVVGVFIISWFILKPKDITKDVESTITVTGQLTNHVTNYVYSVKTDTKFAYITNTTLTDIGDITTVNKVNRDLFAYNHQLMLGATVGYRVNSKNLEFGVGLEYLYKKEKVSFYYETDLNLDHTFKLGYAHVFYRK